MAAPQVRSEVVVRRAGHPGRGESWIAVAWGPCEAGQANGYGTRVMDREGTSREQKRQAGGGDSRSRPGPGRSTSCAKIIARPFPAGARATPCPCLPCCLAPCRTIFYGRLLNTGIARGYEREIVCSGCRCRRQGEWSAGGEKGSRWHHPSRSRRRPRHMERNGGSVCVIAAPAFPGRASESARWL